MSNEAKSDIKQSFIQQTCNKLLDYAEANTDAGLTRRLQKLIEDGTIDNCDVEEICKVKPDEPTTERNNFGLGELDDNRDLLVREIKANPDIIEGILKTDTTAMFVGSSKSYKTWHMIRLGLCVAHGLMWFGKATRKCKVLVINPELIQNEFQLRVRGVARELGISHLDDKFFKSISLHKKFMKPDELMDAIENLVTRDKYELVILDSLYRLYDRGMDENSNADMLRLMIRMEKMVSNHNSAIIFSHHSPKGDQSGKRSIDIAAGAGLGRFVATSITTRIVDEEKKRYSIEFTMRYHKPIASFGLIMDGPKAMVDHSFSKSELNGNNRYNNQAILNILANKTYTVTELQKEVTAQCGMSKSTFFDNYWPAIKETEGVQCVAGKFTYVKPESSTVTATGK